MEILECMAIVQTRLRKHDRAIRQMLLLDQTLIMLNEVAYRSALHCSYMRVMRLMLHKSVIEGVRKMYKVYRLKQWFHVQNLVHQLSLRYRWEYGYELLSQMDAIPTPDLQQISKEDVAAQSWLIMQTEFYRQP